LNAAAGCLFPGCEYLRPRAVRALAEPGFAVQRKPDELNRFTAVFRKLRAGPLRFGFRRGAAPFHRDQYSARREERHAIIERFR
jgi:hypothetical protein